MLNHRIASLVVLCAGLALPTASQAGPQTGAYTLSMPSDMLGTRSFVSAEAPHGVSEISLNMPVRVGSGSIASSMGVDARAPTLTVHASGKSEFAASESITFAGSSTYGFLGDLWLIPSAGDTAKLLIEMRMSLSDLRLDYGPANAGAATLYAGLGFSLTEPMPSPVAPFFTRGFFVQARNLVEDDGTAQLKVWDDGEIDPFGGRVVSAIPDHMEWVETQVVEVPTNQVMYAAFSSHLVLNCYGRSACEASAGAASFELSVRALDGELRSRYDYMGLPAMMPGVPEPETYLLLGLGLITLVGRSRLQRARSSFS